MASRFVEGLDRSQSDCKIIVSDHNFEETPSREELGSLVARIQSTGADIVKVVTTAKKITDVAAVFSTLTSSQVHTFIFFTHHHCHCHSHYHHRPVVIVIFIFIIILIIMIKAIIIIIIIIVIVIIIIIIIIIVTMAIMVIMVMVMVMVMVRISIDPSALVDLVGHGALEWADRHVILVGTADVILLVGVKIIVVVVVDVIMPEPVGQRSQQVVGFLREAAIIGAQYKGGRKRLTLGRHHQNQRSTQTQTYTCQIKELIFWVPLLLLALSGYGC